VRPPDPSRSADLEQWLDRSGLGHHADPVVGPFNHAPVVGGPVAGTTPIVRMRFGDEALLVQQPELSVLRALGSRDFTVLIAATLPCTPDNKSQCFAQKQGIAVASDGGSSMPRGFYLRAIESDLRGRFDVQGFFTEIPPGSARTSALSLRCDEFHLFGARRITGADPGEWQVRVNGNVVATAPVPAAATGAPSDTPLLFAGGDTCGYLEGSLAAAVVVEGVLTDTQTCELEKFLLSRLYEANLTEAPSTLQCN